MPQNDFLPVAIGGVPNVEDQADYEIAVETEQGFATGESPTSMLFNKMLRQSSCIAALFAQMVCDFTAADMLDNGDQATKQALIESMFRKPAFAALNFYCSPAGNDANNGSIGSPWLSIQHAVNYLAQYYDFRDFDITINLANGTYDGAIVLGPFVGQKNTGITIVGNLGAPSSVIIQHALIAEPGAAISINGVKFISDSYAVIADGGVINLGTNLQFGVCTSGHINASRGGRAFRTADYTINGNSPLHLTCDTNSLINTSAINVTLTGAPVFSSAFAAANTNGTINDGNTNYAGATGAASTRYNVQLNGVINTGHGANYFPGNIAGSTATGGQYT